MANIAELNVGIPYSEEVSILREPVVVGGKDIKNRLVAQPIEGFDSGENGAPSARALERYKLLANGGTGTIWMESISVNREGKSSARQMWITDENIAGFSNLVHIIRERGEPYIVAQLTHSGRYSNPDGAALAVCAFENPVIPKRNFRIITDNELDVLCDDYISGAVLAEKAGFDAVDIRVCHGYLINELLAAYNRSGKYGGSYENRTRLLRNIVQGVRRKARITIAVRLNITDGLPYPFGWGCDKSDPKKQDITEPLRLVKELEQLGVSAINVSAGIGACSPHMIRPYDRGGIIPDEHPLQGVERLLHFAKLVKEAAPALCVVASGFTWLRDFAPMVAAGGVKNGWFDLAGFGREWVAYPEYANDILSDGKMHTMCTTCGGCSALIKSGKEVRCVFNKSTN